MELPRAGRARANATPASEFIVTRHLGMGREIFAVLQGQLDRLMKQLAMLRPHDHRRHPARPRLVDAGANGELARWRWLFGETTMNWSTCLHRRHPGCA